MYSRMDIEAYRDEVLRVVSLSSLPWHCLMGKKVGLTGATGMIGSFLIDVLMAANTQRELGCCVVGLGRSEEKARLRLPYFGRNDFSFIECDVSEPGLEISPDVDYVFHLASATHPRQYALDPIGTISANIVGLENTLKWASTCGARLLFASSVEVYGQNRGDVERFVEDYCGYIDCNTLRACYTESKRLGEAMCQAWRSQRGVEAVIARVARVYGPTLLPGDSKALSQFIFRTLSGEEVVLKSAGNQRFSYLYVADAVTGLLMVLLYGIDGEAYNLADDTDITLKDIAAVVAHTGGVGLIFELPDEIETAGYSKSTVALMDASKAINLGWMPDVSLRDGIERTLTIMGRLVKLGI